MSSTPLNKTASNEAWYAPRYPVKLFMRGGTTDTNIIDEVFTRNVYLQHGLHIHPGDVVFDIGGHIGSFTCLALFWRAGEIFTYEPCDENYEMLVKNVRHHDTQGVVTVAHCGVMAQAGKRSFHVREKNYGGSNFYQKGNQQADCVTLAQQFDAHEIETCNFLKLDCEDAELEILESFPYLDCVQQVAVEFVGKDRGDALRAKLEDAGFDTYQEGPGLNRIGFIWASRYGIRD